MPRIEITTIIHAPKAVVFDLARNIDLHQQSQASKKETVVAGRRSGLIELGESVTWEAVHFGIRQRLTSRITQVDRPHSFRDSMVAGAFQRFDHDHFFRDHEDGATHMVDVFDYTSPCGVLGKLADKWFLERYMRNLLSERNEEIKRVAEQDVPPG